MPGLARRRVIRPHSEPGRPIGKSGQNPGAPPAGNLPAFRTRADPGIPIRKVGKIPGIPGIPPAGSSPTLRTRANPGTPIRKYGQYPGARRRVTRPPSDPGLQNKKSGQDPGSPPAGNSPALKSRAPNQEGG